MPERKTSNRAAPVQIDENIRRVYGAPLADDVPTRFRVLLERLASQDIANDRGADLDQPPDA